MRELRYDGRTLCAPDGRRIDVVYRRAVTSDLLAHYAQSEALRLAATRANEEERFMGIGRRSGVGQTQKQRRWVSTDLGDVMGSSGGGGMDP